MEVGQTHLMFLKPLHLVALEEAVFMEQHLVAQEQVDKVLQGLHLVAMAVLVRVAVQVL